LLRLLEILNENWKNKEEFINRNEDFKEWIQGIS
jgi:hypothetical protein